MEKLIYAIWKKDDEPYETLNERLLGRAQERLVALGLDRLKINVIDDHVQGATLYSPSLRPPPVAMVSFWINSSYFRRLFEEILSSVASRIAGYSVLESTILPYRTPAPDGQRSNGFSQISFVVKSQDISQERFLDIWLDSHTKVAVETQATHYYTQNIVLRALSPDAPLCHGIVEEGYSIEALTDPLIYWDARGSDERRKQNYDREMASCGRFLDLTQIDVIVTSEHRFGTWHDLSQGWRRVAVLRAS